MSWLPGGLTYPEPIATRRAPWAGRTLNIGCADCPFVPKGTPGNVNVDIAATGNEDVRADALALPFRPASFETIHAHHVIEHLERDDAIASIIRWYGLLVPRGWLTVVVPDYLKLRMLGDKAERDRILFGLDDAHVSGVHQLHRSSWTDVEVADVLHESGYVDVVIGDAATFSPLVARPAWQGCVRGRRRAE